tara:strand:+ start:318 stop:1127 length:810 start_codon:yes stop_codon:yes gene_type:complete
MYLEQKYSFLKPIKTNYLQRYGVKFDGGYVIDSKVIGCSNKLVSFGLGTDWSFELDYLKLIGNKIHLYDYTTTYRPYFKEIFKYLRRFITFRVPYRDLRVKIDGYLRLKKFLNNPNVKFFREKITFPINNKNETDLKKVFTRLDHKDSVVLKCDIEGSEYKIIEQIYNLSHRIDMLIIEFHWINKSNNEKVFVESIKKLKEKFNIIHLHGNNYSNQSNTGLPDVLEVTLTNLKFTPDVIEYKHKFPIKDLDFPNDNTRKDIEIFFKQDD